MVTVNPKAAMLSKKLKADQKAKKVAKGKKVEKQKRHCDCSNQPLRYPHIPEIFEKQLLRMEAVVHAMWSEGTTHLSVNQLKSWTNRVQTMGDHLLVLLRDLEYPNHHVLHRRLVDSGYYENGKEPDVA